MADMTSEPKGPSDFQVKLDALPLTMATRSEPLSIESLLQNQKAEKEAASKVCSAHLDGWSQSFRTHTSTSTPSPSF